MSEISRLMCVRVCVCVCVQSSLQETWQLDVAVLGGSGDLVSKVIGQIGVISSYKYSYPTYNPNY